jgi:integrase
MARSTRSTTIETRTARLKLPVSGKPVFVKLGKQLGLGYRRNKTAGTWVMRVADGNRGNWLRAIGTADDFDEADGTDVLDFWQAQEKARTLARENRGDGSPDKPLTVGQALDRYEADLTTRGGDPGNVTRVLAYMPAALSRKPLPLLGARDLRSWRDTLAKTLAPATVNRSCNGLKAALNLAADHDERIISRRAWEVGLSAIPGAQESRNVILPDDTVRRMIAEAHATSPKFALLVEVAAVTGARVSQLARLEVQDLQDGTAARLMMPASRKGKGTKAVLRRPVPISSTLAARLATASNGRPAIAPLIAKPNGAPWGRCDHSVPFARLARRCGLDPAEVTMYALRHSNIVRQLLAGVPVRVVAVNHDTSVVMIERTYSRHIGDHADALARGALLNTEISSS